MKKLIVAPAILSMALLSGCVGMAIETATDAAIAVGKIPFKVGGAVVDVVTPDSDDKKKDEESSEK